MGQVRNISHVQDLDGARTGRTPVLAKAPKRKKQDDVTPSRWPKSRKRAEAIHILADLLIIIVEQFGCWEAVKEKHIEILKDIFFIILHVRVARLHAGASQKGQDHGHAK